MPRSKSADAEPKKETLRDEWKAIVRRSRKPTLPGKPDPHAPRTSTKDKPSPASRPS